METCVAAHRECLNGPTPRTPRAVGASTDDCVHGGPDLDGRRAHRNKVAHALVHELLAQGHLCRAVARNLGWGLNTVLRYARTATCQDTLRGNRPRPSRLAPYELYLERRFAAGRTNITRLHHELISQNAPGAYRVLRAYIAALRAAPPQTLPPRPTVRRVTGWLTRRPATPSEDERAALKDVLARCPERDTAAEHVQGVALLVSSPAKLA